MSRLQYSLSAYRRRMQMSQTVLFIFIEGYMDRYVYDKIVDSECKGSDIDYKIVTDKELQINAVGKQALLKFFIYLRRRASLIDRFKGKTTLSVFFLDKDVDDFLRIKRRSEHVVYTETYELENYLFMYGDLTEAAAASALLETDTIRDDLGSYNEWRKRAAATWIEWIKLCLFSHTRKINSFCNYGHSRSPINDEVYGSLNTNKYTELLSTLKRQSGLPLDRFKRSFTRLSKVVDRMYSDGQHDFIFKGKWYSCFLAEDIRRIASSRSFDSQRLKKRLLSSLALTLNTDDDWAEHFKAPIRRLLTEAEI